MFFGIARASSSQAKIICDVDAMHALVLTLLVLISVFPNILDLHIFAQVLRNLESKNRAVACSMASSSWKNRQSNSCPGGY